MKKKRRNIVEDGLTKEDFDRLWELLGGRDQKFVEPIEREDKTEQDFYEDLKNWKFESLPKQVQLYEIMLEESITEGHPMYEEMVTAIEDTVNYEISRGIEQGGNGDCYIPLTREEYMVWFYMLCELLQDKPAIPKEYRHLIELFK
ncbi:hypothetical protein AS52_00249 [Priestia megaterium Q3]|uniref:Uncharacterized protein n=1 Tax=Priestia megaterium Q3 TaxID=1452722 RepID=A0A806TBU0_PRIMG|nr:hypothetical protein [Priestia megaterium]AKP75270.1 hypothetical protein AS52_00249 [Priestia megaterium Q3]